MDSKTGFIADSLNAIVAPDHVWLVVIRSPRLMEPTVHRAFWTLDAAEASIAKDRHLHGWDESVDARCERIAVMACE